MTTATLTLAEFLLARITEDEAVARAASEAKSTDWMSGGDSVPAGGRWDTEPDWGMVYSAGGRARGLALWDDEGSARLCPEPAIAEHIARHDPARVLAQCEAYRQIVDEHRGGKWPHPADPCDAHDFASGASIPCDTLRALAAIWSDHPDYSEEWRP